MGKVEQIYKLPEGWGLVDLGNIAFINMGQSPPSSSYNYNQMVLPFYQGKSEFVDSQRFVVKHIGWSLKKAIARPKPAKELAYPNAQADCKIDSKMIENE